MLLLLLWTHLAGQVDIMTCIKVDIIAEKTVLLYKVLFNTGWCRMKGRCSVHFVRPEQHSISLIGMYEQYLLFTSLF